MILFYKKLQILVRLMFAKSRNCVRVLLTSSTL